MPLQNRGRVAIAVVSLMALLTAIAGFAYLRLRGGTTAGPSLFERGSAVPTGSIFHDLPADSFCAGGVADVQQFADQVKRTAVGTILFDPKVEEQMRRAMDGDAAAQQLDRLLVGMGRAKEFGMRSIGFAVFPVPDADSPGLAVLSRCDDPARLASWIEQQRSESTVIESASAGGVSFRCDVSVCIATRANDVVVASPRSAMVRLLEGTGGHLDQVERFRSATGAVSSAGMFGFIDLRALVTAYRQRIDETAAAQSPQLGAVIQLVKLESWDHVVVSERVEDEVFRGRIAVSYDRAAGSLLASLLEAPNAELKLDAMLPGDSSTVMVAQMRDPARTWDEVLGAIRGTLDGEAREKLDQQLQMTRVFGFDLREDLFAALGGELGFASTLDVTGGALVDMQQALATARVLIIVSVVEPSKIEGLLARLDALGVVAKTTPIGDGKLREISLPSPGVQPGIGLANGKLILGNRVEDVRAAFDGKLASLAQNTAYANMRSRLPREVGTVSYEKALPFRITDLVELSRKESGRDREKQKTSFATIGSIAKALDSYMAQNGKPPTASAETLVAALDPAQTGGLDDHDGWGNPVGYYATDKSYVVWSTGADGKADLDWTTCAAGCPDWVKATTAIDADIVASAGSFVRWPDPETVDPQVSPELVELMAELDRRLQTLPPSVAVMRTVDQGLEYEYVAPIALSVAGASAFATMVLPRLDKGQQRSKVEVAR